MVGSILGWAASADDRAVCARAAVRFTGTSGIGGRCSRRIRGHLGLPPATRGSTCCGFRRGCIAATDHGWDRSSASCAAMNFGEIVHGLEWPPSAVMKPSPAANCARSGDEENQAHPTGRVLLALWVAQLSLRSHITRTTGWSQLRSRPPRAHRPLRRQRQPVRRDHRQRPP